MLLSQINGLTRASGPAQSDPTVDYNSVISNYYKDPKPHDVPKILEKLIEKPFDVDEYIKKEKLEAVSDTGELEKYCKEAIKESSQAVEDYKKGEEK